MHSFSSSSRNSNYPSVIHRNNESSKSCPLILPRWPYSILCSVTITSLRLLYITQCLLFTAKIVPDNLCWLVHCFTFLLFSLYTSVLAVRHLPQSASCSLPPGVMLCFTLTFSLITIKVVVVFFYQRVIYWKCCSAADCDVWVKYSIER